MRGIDVFEDLNINSSVKNSLVDAIKASRLSHAVIIEGANETARQKVALTLAMALLCTGINKPCGECKHCLKVKNSCHPDLHILTKDEKSAMIKVDAIRDIKSQATVLPNDGDKSVFIINEAQFMNVQSQNALLKIFEEPSKHISFILTCSSKSALLETIRSRATAYYLGEESDTQDDEKKNEANKTANMLLQCFIKESEFRFISKTAMLKKDKAMFLLVLKEMASVSMDALVLSSGGRVPQSENAETTKMLRSALTQKKLLELYEGIDKITQNTEKSANFNLSLTRLSAVLYAIKQKG